MHNTAIKSFFVFFIFTLLYNCSTFSKNANENNLLEYFQDSVLEQERSSTQTENYSYLESVYDSGSLPDEVSFDLQSFEPVVELVAGEETTTKFRGEPGTLLKIPLNDRVYKEARLIVRYTVSGKSIGKVVAYSRALQESGYAFVQIPLFLDNTSFYHGNVKVDILEDMKLVKSVNISVLEFSNKNLSEYSLKKELQFALKELKSLNKNSLARAIKMTELLLSIIDKIGSKDKLVGEFYKGGTKISITLRMRDLEFINSYVHNLVRSAPVHRRPRLACLKKFSDRVFCFGLGAVMLVWPPALVAGFALALSLVVHEIVNGERLGKVYKELKYDSFLNREMSKNTDFIGDSFSRTEGGELSDIMGQMVCKTSKDCKSDPCASKPCSSASGQTCHGKQIVSISYKCNNSSPDYEYTCNKVQNLVNDCKYGCLLNRLSKKPECVEPCDKIVCNRGVIASVCYGAGISQKVEGKCIIHPTTYVPHCDIKYRLIENCKGKGCVVVAGKPRCN